MVNLISGYQGGMSQDDHFLGEGQSIYSHGFDITRSPGELKLMPPIVPYEAITETENIASIFSPEDGIIWYGTGDGKVRNFLTGGLIIDTGDTRDVIDGILFLGKFYIFTNRYVYVTTYTAGVLSGISTYYDPGTSEGWHHPVIYQGGEMYFPSGKNIKYTDSLGVINTMFSTDFSNKVRAISVQGSTLRVYSEKLISIIDIGSKTVSYSQVCPFSVNGITSDGNVDYVTTDANEMYVCSGLEWRKIVETENSSTLANSDYVQYKYTFRSNQNAKTIANGNSRVFTIDTLAPRFMIYGKKMEGLPNAFCYGPIHDTTSSGGVNVFPLESVDAIFCQNNILYIAYEVNNVIKGGRIQLDDTTSVNCYEGVWISPSFDMGDFSLLKAIDEIRVGKEGTLGELWVSINNGAYVLADALDQTELENKTTDFKKDFRKISFMFKLYSGNDRINNLDLRITSRPV